jgi:ribonuclease HII
MILDGRGISKSELRSLVPSLDWERGLWSDGAGFVAGLDEVGRGPLAGPLLAAAVVLPSLPEGEWLSRVRDSKLLTAAGRESLDGEIRRDALSFGVGVVSAGEVDRLGVVRATHRAMRQALFRLSARPDHLLVDALRIPRLRIAQTPLIHGDGRCVSIACASIVAKVARDRLMEQFNHRFPGYGFRENKGYGTAAHLDALRRLGPCAIHRRSFAPVRGLLEDAPPGGSRAG